MHDEHEVPSGMANTARCSISPSNRTASATTRGPDEVNLKDKSNWIKARPTTSMAACSISGRGGMLRKRYRI